MKNMIIAGVALLALSGAATAHAYPPDQGGDEGVVQTTVRGQDSQAGTLPESGSDASEPLLLGAAALTAGVGLVVITRRRRSDVVA